MALDFRGTRIVDLEQPRFAGMPIHPAHLPGYFYALHRRHSDNPGRSPRTSASGMLTMMEHTGTHIDALSHQAADGCLHGGIDAVSAESASGFASHGVEEIPPIVARAVFADIAKSKGVERLPERYEFTAADLIESLGDAEPNPGDILLVRVRDPLERRGGLPQGGGRASFRHAMGGGKTSRRSWGGQHGVGRTRSYRPCD